jgi:hypothetical protein
MRQKASSVSKNDYKVCRMSVPMVIIRFNYDARLEGSNGFLRYCKINSTKVVRNDHVRSNGHNNIIV